MSVRLEHPEHEIEKEHQHERPEILCHAPGREGEEEEDKPILCQARPPDEDGGEEEERPILCQARPPDEDGGDEHEREREALAAPPAGLAERWRQKHAQSSEIEFGQLWSELTAFLEACAASREAMRPPSARVDELWHEFILFTREYHAFCSRLGGYVHHAPDV